MSSYDPKYDKAHAPYMGFLSQNNDHHGNEWHYTIPDIELTQTRVCPNGGTESIKRILPLGFNNSTDPFYLAPFGVPCSVPPLAGGPGSCINNSCTSTSTSSTSSVKFNPPSQQKSAPVPTNEQLFYDSIGGATCGLNENGVNYSFGGGPCCPAPLQPLGHKLLHSFDLNGPAVDANVHHYYNNLGCPYNDDEALNGWGTSVITNDNYKDVIDGCGVYCDSASRYRTGHFLIVLEKARPGETPNYDELPVQADGKRYALSINGIQGRHMYLQRGRRYYFTFKSKIGKADEEINDSPANNIIFTNSKKGGPSATLLFGTLAIPHSTTAWLRVPREFPSTFFLQSTLFADTGTIVNIDRYGAGHGYHY